MFDRQPWFVEQLPGRSESDLDRILTGLPLQTARVLSRALAGSDLSADDLMSLFALEGTEAEALFAVAHFQRIQGAGFISTYVVNRNINFTNICYNHCRFCAYSRSRFSPDAFSLSLDEILRQAEEAYRLGATEVCIQAGLSPDLDASFYPRLCRMIRESLPDIHIHGCSPQEVMYWSREAGRSMRDYLIELKDSGLNSLPGTSAEILDDDIRAMISPRRITTREWMDVVKTAHSLGLRTSATIMYGHVENPRERSLHLLRLRDLQRTSGGFTEFVPLSLVSDSNGGRGRRLRLKRSIGNSDVFKMHAIARLALGKEVPNIQVSWVKEGVETAKACLRAGANDLGGTLMNESISSSAGAKNGELMRPCELRAAIRAAGFVPAQRDTLYRLIRRFDNPADDPIDPLDRSEPAGLAH
ncbi:MAG: 5-amino-6-(D-ribitylamino)uracil--L-tyrosine 4-hydroxyphenyl transferase CofH [Acidobacteriota bacterium]